MPILSALLCTVLLEIETGSVLRLTRGGNLHEVERFYRGRLLLYSRYFILFFPPEGRGKEWTVASGLAFEFSGRFRSEPVAFQGVDFPMFLT